MIKIGLYIVSIVIAIFMVKSCAGLDTGSGAYTEPSNKSVKKVEDTIAYLTSSRMKKNIHLINSDGSNDRLLWASPENLLISQSIGTLAWRPDGTELAFDSDHMFGMSLYGRDLYVVASDGSYLRKITNNPEAKHLKGFKTGSATMKSKNWLSGGSNFWAYIEGALSNETWLAAANYEYTITFDDIADFGEGVSQMAVLGYVTRENRRLCRYDLAGVADIVAREKVEIIQDFDVWSNKFQHCITIRQPSWNYNGEKILFTTISNVNPYRQGLQDSNSEDYNIMMSESEKLPIANKGDKIGRFKFFANDPKFIELSPNKEEDLLIVMHKDSTDRIYITNTNNPDKDQLDRIEIIDLGFCHYDDIVDYKSDICSIRDVEWSSDGRSFFISMQITKNSYDKKRVKYLHRIYRHTLSDGNTEMIFSLEGKDEYIGNITASASGEKVAFERASRYDGPYDIWIYDKANDDLKLLVKDGANPAWSR